MVILISKLFPTKSNISVELSWCQLFYSCARGNLQRLNICNARPVLQCARPALMQSIAMLSGVRGYIKELKIPQIYLVAEAGPVDDGRRHLPKDPVPSPIRAICTIYRLKILTTSRERISVNAVTDKGNDLSRSQISAV